MRFLEQSTAATVKIGPFLDEDDGKTAETALTIAQADIRLTKNGGNYVEVTHAQGGGNLTHDENGWYDLDIDTTDTNTLGRLTVAIHEAGALPVWHEFNVIPTEVYDSVFGSSAVTTVATTLSQKVNQFWRALFKKVVVSASAETLKTYKDDGTTVVTTQTISDDGTTLTQGAAT